MTSADEFLTDDDVIQLMKLDENRTRKAGKMRLERAWKIAQGVAHDLRQPRLERIKVAHGKYRYVRRAVDQFIKLLATEK